MYPPLNLAGILVAVAAETELVRRRRRQLDVRDVPVRSHFMTSGAAGSDRRVHKLALALIFMAADTGGRVRFRIEGHRVLNRKDWCDRQQRAQNKELERPS